MGISRIHRFGLILLLTLFAAETPAAPTVVGYQLVSKKRSGRTTVDYTYRLRIANASPAYTNAVFTVTSSSVNTTVLDSDVQIASIPATYSGVSADTFQIRQNRVVPFSTAALSWTFAGTAAGNLPTISLRLVPSTIKPGQFVRVIWSTTDATSCHAAEAWTGNRASAGNEVVGPLYHDSTIQLECTGPGGTHQASDVIDVSAPIQLIDFSFVEFGGRPAHEGLKPMTGSPAPGIQTAMVSLSGAPVSGMLTLRGIDGMALTTVPLTAIDMEALPVRSFTAGVVVPDKAFRTEVSGIDDDGQSFQFLLPKVWTPSGIDLDFASGVPILVRGQTASVNITVRSHGDATQAYVTCASTSQVPVTAPVGGIAIASNSAATIDVAVAPTLQLPAEVHEVPLNCSVVAAGGTQLGQSTNASIDLLVESN